MLTHIGYTQFRELAKNFGTCCTFPNMCHALIRCAATIFLKKKKERRMLPSALYPSRLIVTLSMSMKNLVNIVIAYLDAGMYGTLPLGNLQFSIKLLIEFWEFSSYKLHLIFNKNWP